MRNPQRSFVARLGVTAVIVVGVLGALAAVDAVLLFFVLLFTGPTPYGGLLLIVAVPTVVLLGTAAAWMAYSVVRRQTPQVRGGDRRIGV